MLKTLFFVQQSLSLIPPIGTFLFWLIRDPPSSDVCGVIFVFVLLSVIPFVLIILVKYINLREILHFQNWRGRGKMTLRQLDC